MTKCSSDHAVFLWVYNNYKSLFAFERDENLLETKNIICFERLMQKI